MPQNVLLMLCQRFFIILFIGNKCRDTCKCIGCENVKNSTKDKKPDCPND